VKIWTQNHCERRWLSHAKVLHRPFELKEEMNSFLSDSNNTDDVNICYNEDFNYKLAYLVDMPEKLV